jgi:hypothetical protein
MKHGLMHLQLRIYAADALVIYLLLWLGVLLNFVRSNGVTDELVKCCTVRDNGQCSVYPWKTQD